nr:MAG TPA: hypothetical protein [Caudoviricetes sp.]
MGGFFLMWISKRKLEELRRALISLVDAQSEYAAAKKAENEALQKRMAEAEARREESQKRLITDIKSRFSETETQLAAFREEFEEKLRELKTLRMTYAQEKTARDIMDEYLNGAKEE